jgi:Cu2+-containing amine oxidase
MTHCKTCINHFAQHIHLQNARMPLSVDGNHFGLLIQNVKKETLATASSTQTCSI